MLRDTRCEESSVNSIDPLLSIAGVGDQFLRFEPQVDLVLGSVWAITPVDNVPECRRQVVLSQSSNNRRNSLCMLPQPGCSEAYL